MKPLIIGEAPSKNEYPPTPIAGRIGRRLADMAGLTFEDFLEKFERVNLLAVRQDTAEKGFEFDLEYAKTSAMLLSMTLRLRPAVILLGRRVAKAFDLKDDYFAPLTINGAPAWIVPHPSGVSRWWNDPENEEKMRTFMIELVRGL